MGELLQSQEHSEQPKWLEKISGMRMSQRCKVAVILTLSAIAGISHGQDPEDSGPSEEQIAEMIEGVKERFNHPTAKVKKRRRPGKNDESVIIRTQDNGLQTAQSLLHLHRSGWMREQELFRRAFPIDFAAASDANDAQDSIEPADIQPQYRGSSFAVEIDNELYFVTNVHLLESAASDIEELCIRIPERDIALIPAKLMQGSPDTRQGIIPVTISETLTNQDLNGREVHITGFGAHLYDIVGKALLPEHCVHYPECNDCTSEFLVNVPIDLITPEDVPGMSGSRTVDVLTKETVGVVHSILPVGMNDKIDFFQINFSGPDDLREARDQAAVHRVMYQHRNELQEAVERRNP